MTHPAMIGYRVNASFNPDMIRIKVESSGIDDLWHQTAIDVVHLKDKAIRNALIAMGWTPPTPEAEAAYLKTRQAASQTLNKEHHHGYAEKRAGTGR